MTDLARRDELAAPGQQAWPPPVLPTNKTNQTAQLDDHPAAHNAANAAINDLVTRASANPTGTLIGARGVSALPPGATFHIECESIICAMDGAGWGSFAFKNWFSGPPLVICMSGDINTIAYGHYTFVERVVNGTIFGFTAMRYDGDWVKNTNIRLNYIAIGYR